MAGSVTVEIVSPHVEAWIGKNAIVDANSAGIPAHPGSANGEKGNTNVNVSAVDNLQIDSTDGAGGVGVVEWLTTTWRRRVALLAASVVRRGIIILQFCWWPGGGR